MGQRIYLPSGARYGLLTVVKTLEQNDENNNGLTEFVCDCGKEATIRTSAVKLGYVRSCGCLSYKELKIFAGDKFGHLTVIEKDEDSNRNKVRCLCRCGSEASVFAHQLKSGMVKSCGCFKGNHNQGKRIPSLTIMTGDRFSKLRY